MADDEEDGQDGLSWARTEVNKGQADLAELAKNYVDARKHGLRDKATMEYLGPQPDMFDTGTRKDKKKKKKKQKQCGESKISKLSPEQAKSKTGEIQSKPEAKPGSAGFQPASELQAGVRAAGVGEPAFKTARIKTSEVPSKVAADLSRAEAAPAQSVPVPDKAQSVTVRSPVPKPDFTPVETRRAWPKDGSAGENASAEDDFWGTPQPPAPEPVASVPSVDNPWEAAHPQNPAPAPTEHPPSKAVEAPKSQAQNRLFGPTASPKNDEAASPRSDNRIFGASSGSTSASKPAAPEKPPTVSPPANNQAPPFNPPTNNPAADSAGYQPASNPQSESDSPPSNKGEFKAKFTRPPVRPDSPPPLSGVAKADSDQSPAAEQKPQQIFSAPRPDIPTPSPAPVEQKPQQIFSAPRPEIPAPSSAPAEQKVEIPENRDNRLGAVAGTSPPPPPKKTDVKPGPVPMRGGAAAPAKPESKPFIQAPPQSTPHQVMPQQANPAQSAPPHSAPEQAVPPHSAPEQATPVQAAPAQAPPPFNPPTQVQVQQAMSSPVVPAPRPDDHVPFQQKPPVVVPAAEPCADPKKAAAFDKWHRPTAEVSKIVIPAKPSQERKITYKYPDGSATTVTYDTSNILVEIKIDGGSWKKNVNQEGWTFFDEKGRKQDQMDGNLDVSERGDIIATRKDGYSETQFADGTFQIQFPDKRKEIHYPDGWCVLEDAEGNRVYRNKSGVETKVAAEKKGPEQKPLAQAQAKPDLKKSGRPHRMTELNKKLTNVLDYNEEQKKWIAYEGQEQEDGTFWFKNAMGDILKQDLKDESNTIYHQDGSWEYIDKHGKVTIHLGDDWANLD